MQRKGGDAGRETANMLQFKIDPAEIFNIKIQMKGEYEKSYVVEKWKKELKN